MCNKIYLREHNYDIVIYMGVKYNFFFIFLLSLLPLMSSTGSVDTVGVHRPQWRASVDRWTVHRHQWRVVSDHCFISTDVSGLVWYISGCFTKLCAIHLGSSWTIKPSAPALLVNNIFQSCCLLSSMCVQGFSPVCMYKVSLQSVCARFLTCVTWYIHHYKGFSQKSFQT